MSRLNEYLEAEKFPQRIKKDFKNQKEKGFKVGDLIKHLQKFPKDMLVGRSGHFGEFNSMNANDFYMKNAYLIRPRMERRTKRQYKNIKCYFSRLRSRSRLNISKEK